MLWRIPFRSYFIPLITGAIYILVGYFTTREQSFQFLFLTFGLFGLSYFSLQKSSINQILWQGLLYRGLLLFTLPWLSQDFYRFIWDGLLVFNDLNPYAYTPNELINQPQQFSALAGVLHENMGELSAGHYSNYPPINQFGFLFAVLWESNSLFTSIIVMRLLLIAADIGLFFLGKQLLKFFGFAQERIGWYFLNPLVVIELTGNLHWEGVMLFFFVLGWWLYAHKKPWLSSIAFALSVGTKLIPLLLVPVFIRYQSWKKSVLMACVGLLSLLLLFLPFFKDIGLENYLATIQLWFKNFEFNGSLYYIVRWIGYEIKGYNIIRQVGEVTPWLVVLIVLGFSCIKAKKTAQQVFTAMLLLLSCYYFIASIVHPWYIISLVFLSLFTRFSFPLFWSALVLLSYVTYAHPSFQENYYLIGIEYGIVFAVLGYELVKKKTLLQHF